MPDVPEDERPTLPAATAGGRPASSHLNDEAALRGCATHDFEGQARPQLGPVVLSCRIGSGGMGFVYAGTHLRLGKDVAVKVLPRTDFDRFPELGERLLREARLAATIDSPHVVRVLDADEDPGSGCHYIVMELVDGESAGDWLRRLGRGVTEADALEVCAAATRGLAAAHAGGIVHRDVKPDNILIPQSASGAPQQGGAKLADLGLARHEDSGQGLTATNVAMGTPGFMAPEQVRSTKEAGPPADVFGMGATLYALLTGTAPFAGSHTTEAFLKTAAGEYEALDVARPDVSRATADLVRVCLRVEPARRFPDAAALLDALQTSRSGNPLDLGELRGPDADTPESLVGATIAECTVTGVRREGPATVVYDAHDENVATAVTLHVLSRRFAGVARVTASFISDSFALAKSGLRGTPTVHKVGRDETRELHYAIHERPDGTTLAELVVSSGALAPQRVLGLLVQAAKTLATTHDTGRVHGALAPEHLLVGAGDGLKILGWYDHLAEDSSSPFASPEQRSGLPVFFPTDAYSLGLTLCFALTGRRPDAGGASEEIAAAVATLEDERPEDDALQRIGPILRRLVSKESGPRMRTLREVVAVSQDAPGASAPPDSSPPRQETR